MKKMTMLAGLLAAASLVTAPASVILVEAADGSSAFLAGASDYQAAVDAACWA